MRLLYNKESGIIYTTIGSDVDYMRQYRDYPLEILDNLQHIDIECEFENRDMYKFKIENDRLISRSENEILDILLYGRVLTEDEILLNKLKPSLDEIQKAENTIEILTLLSEVL